MIAHVVTDVTSKSSPYNAIWPHTSQTSPLYPTFSSLINLASHIIFENKRSKINHKPNLIMRFGHVSHKLLHSIRVFVLLHWDGTNDRIRNGGEGHCEIDLRWHCLISNNCDLRHSSEIWISSLVYSPSYLPRHVYARHSTFVEHKRRIFFFFETALFFVQKSTVCRNRFAVIFRRSYLRNSSLPLHSVGTHPASGRTRTVRSDTWMLFIFIFFPFSTSPNQLKCRTQNS